MTKCWITSAITLLVFLAFSSCEKMPQLTDECVDRDGRSYKTVPIGFQIWMAENLAYLPTVNPKNTDSETEKRYYVYDYDGTIVNDAKKRSNYNTFGVLYNWEAAKTACPDGWHLPSFDEWMVLIHYLGDSMGEKMKSTTGWYNYGNGDNLSGFDARPGGYVSGWFMDLLKTACFWSSTEDGSSTAKSIRLYYSSDGLSPSGLYRGLGFSVRCLKD